MYTDTDTDMDMDCTDWCRSNGITIQLYHLNNPKVSTDTYTYIEVLLKAKRTIKKLKFIDKVCNFTYRYKQNKKTDTYTDTNTERDADTDTDTYTNMRVRHLILRPVSTGSLTVVLNPKKEYPVDADAREGR